MAEKRLFLLLFRHRLGLDVSVFCGLQQEQFDVTPTLNSSIGGVIIAIIIIIIDIITKMIVVTIRRRQTGADAAGGTKQRDRC